MYLNEIVFVEPVGTHGICPVVLGSPEGSRKFPAWVLMLVRSLRQAKQVAVKQMRLG